jgi:glycosyltransferase involved in cell wall biosynthesis
MKIEAYLLTWNESDIIGLVIKHYQKFCDKVIIMDNYSSDNTCKIAESMGCEVRKFGTQFFDDFENMKCKNNCWKGSDADWVIVCDADEVLYFGDSLNPSFEDLASYLHGSPYHVYRPQGWQIMSDEMPVNDLLEITNGYEFNNYSKCILFSPWLLEIKFNPGAHRCNPIAPSGIEVDICESSSMYVLHYKHIGGVHRTIKRYAEYKKRLSRNNIKNGWGIHYNRTIPSLKEEWNERMAKSKPLI